MKDFKTIVEEIAYSKGRADGIDWCTKRLSKRNNRKKEVKNELQEM